MLLITAGISANAILQTLIKNSLKCFLNFGHVNFAAGNNQANQLTIVCTDAFHRFHQLMREKFCLVINATENGNETIFDIAYFN